MRTILPLLLLATIAHADPLSPNTADEPIAMTFSLQKALDFLDTAAVNWQNDHACFTCHTNYSYLLARPMISADAPAHREVRAFAEKMIADWATAPPKRYYEAPGHAAYLSINDALTTHHLQPATRTALDRMWTLQKDDGSFKFPDCKWPPMESDQHFGNTMVALALGMAPDDYAKSPAVQPGLVKLRDWLSKNPPQNLHQRAMLMWASLHLDGLMPADQIPGVVAELRAGQNPDGGWPLTRFGDYKRGDGKPQTSDSDGYGTGFTIFILRQASVPASDPQIQRGIEWLKTHQRESGRWFTRSAFKDSKHYITHASTAFALMALASCGEAHAAGQ